MPEARFHSLVWLEQVCLSCAQHCLYGTALVKLKTHDNAGRFPTPGARSNLSNARLLAMPKACPHSLVWLEQVSLSFITVYMPLFLQHLPTRMSTRDDFQRQVPRQI